MKTTALYTGKEDGILCQRSPRMLN